MDRYNNAEVTLREAADVTGFSLSAWYSWCETNAIEHRRVLGKIKVPVREVARITLQGGAGKRRRYSARAERAVAR